MKKMTARKLKRFRIYTTEKDCMDGIPLYEWLAQKAYMMGMDGASVFHAIGGFCKTTPFCAGRRVFEISRPVVLEIIETEEKLKSFMGVVQDIFPHGIMTVEDVELYCYGEKHG